jgi:hypothetical protein
MSAKKHRVPMPKWMAETTIKYERKNQSTTSKKSGKQTNQSKKKTTNTPRIKTTSIEAKCSCEGENENCFRCNGTGFYKSKIITNLEECRARVQEKLIRKIDFTQESNFSNDQRGGLYGIRENGRFSSNPLYDEDI